jgi:hypothetical protein
LLHRRTRHYLAAIRAGVDMAVTAGLIAELADVDLQDLNARGLERQQPLAGEGLLERQMRAVRQYAKLVHRLGQGMALTQ